MREDFCSGAAPPAGERPPVFKVVYPSTERPLEIVVVNPAWLGLDCHWHKPPGWARERTTLCLAPDSCVCLSEVVPNKWHGYLGAARWSDGQRVIVSITDRTARSIADVVGSTLSLRGVCLILKRKSGHKCSPVVAELNPKRWSYPLPPQFDVLPSLAALYGQKEIEAWKRLMNLTD